MKQIVFGDGSISLGKENADFTSLSNFFDQLTQRGFLARKMQDDRVTYSFNDKIESLEAKAFFNGCDFMELVLKVKEQNITVPKLVSSVTYLH